MLVRTEQLEILAQARRERFITEMVAHLRSHFTREVAGLDDRALRKQVEASLAKARGYGLSSAQDYVRFLNLGASLGWEFDQDPARPWIGAYLRDPEVADPSERLGRVARRCIRVLATEENNRKARASR